MSDRSVRAVRSILIGVGLVLLGFGAYTLHQTVRPASIRGLVVWLAAAVVLNDAVLAPFVVAIGILLRRAGRRLAPWSIVVVQAAVALAAVLAATVLPEIDAKHHVQRNPTVVPFDYTLRLGIAEAVLALVVVVALAVALRLSASARRTSDRRSSTPHAG